MKLEGDLRRSQRACQQLDTQKVSLLPAFSLVKCFGTQCDLLCIFIVKKRERKRELQAWCIYPLKLSFKMHY